MREAGSCAAACSISPTFPTASTRLDPGFGQFQLEGEVEKDYALGGRAGSIKLTGFLTRGRMGAFADAIALSRASGQPADVALVRRYRGRGGVSLDLEQQMMDEFGLFARGGVAGGSAEPYEFTDIDNTISLGVSLTGKRWGRVGDTLAVAGVVNGISKIHQQYLAAGGLGILVGDGRLPHPGRKKSSRPTTTRPWARLFTSRSTTSW